jgi:hypothetical protein
MKTREDPPEESSPEDELLMELPGVDSLQDEPGPPVKSPSQSPSHGVEQVEAPPSKPPDMPQVTSSGRVVRKPLRLKDYI